MRHLDLCSGIGGFALGFQWAGLSKPVMFCDNDEWCRKVLTKHWPDVPISTDVKELANGIPRRVDRLRGLGNAIVPQIAMKIGLAIKEQE